MTITTTTPTPTTANSTATNEAVRAAAAAYAHEMVDLQERHPPRWGNDLLAAMATTGLVQAARILAATEKDLGVAIHAARLSRTDVSENHAACTVRLAAMHLQQSD